MSGYIEDIGGPLTGIYGNYIEDNNVAALNSFNGNFASLFTSPFQSVQSDLGLTYGSTLRATGTTPPVITLTGTLSTTPVPITVLCTLLGVRGVWTGTYSFDGGSTTTSFTSAATVALTGKGAGLTLNIATGAAAINDQWQATCSGLADQSGNGFNYSQATSSAQPIITVGLNGKPGLLFDGVTNTLASAFNHVQPIFTWSIFRVLGNASGSGAITGGSGQCLVYVPTGTKNLAQYAGALPAGVTSSNTGAWGRSEAAFANLSTDYIKFGSVSNTPSAAGSNALGVCSIADLTFGTVNFEWLATVYSLRPTITQLNTLSVAVTSFYGASVLV